MSKLDELMEMAVVAADIRASDTAEFYAGRRVSERNYKEALHALESALKAVLEDAERYQWLRDPNNMRARELFRYYGDVNPTELDEAVDAARKA